MNSSRKIIGSATNEFLLVRNYHAAAVNGVLYFNHNLVCYTIELPWKQNRARVSCIPEGSYPMVKRWSEKFKCHLYLPGVTGRSLILIHPANNALKELKGCIAPVKAHSGIGTGTQSKWAMNKIMRIVNQLRESQQVRLRITSGGTASVM